MKFTRKCPICKRQATKRLGNLDFCDTHKKVMRKLKEKYVWTDIHIETFHCDDGEKLCIYRDILLKV